MTKKIRLYQPFGDLGCQRPVLLRYLFRNISKYTVRFIRPKINSYLENSLNTCSSFYYNPLFQHVGYHVIIKRRMELIIFKGVLYMNNNDRLRRSNFVLIGLVILMLLYGIISRMITGDTSLYIFGIPVIAPKETQEENTNSEAPSNDARALFETIDEMLG